MHLLGARPFVVYTDHASLRTATNSPHLSQRMARWLSFFAEYNFRVEYKPGKANVLADALSRRPDLEQVRPDLSSRPLLEAAVASTRRGEPAVELARVSVSSVRSALRDEIKALYAQDEQCRLLLAHFSGEKVVLPPRLAAKLSRFSLAEGLLWHRISDDDYVRVVVPNDDDLRHQLLAEFHDVPTSGHLGREKTFLSLSAHFWWPHLYKWVSTFTKTCEVCQRVKPSPSRQAPLHPLPIPTDCWESVSLDFVYGYPADRHGNTGIVVFVDRLSKMVHTAAVSKEVSGAETAEIFISRVFRHHGLPVSIVSDRDPRFTGPALFDRLGTSLRMSTADHPESDGQTERANRVVEDILRSHCTSFPREWSAMLPFVDFAINNSVHASTGHTPFYLNGLRHPRVPSTLFGDDPILEGGEAQSTDSVAAPTVAAARSVHRPAPAPLMASPAALVEAIAGPQATADATDPAVTSRQIAKAISDAHEFITTRAAVITNVRYVLGPAEVLR